MSQSRYHSRLGPEGLTVFPFHPLLFMAHSFAYLLGKCFWLGRGQGFVLYFSMVSFGYRTDSSARSLTLFVNLGFAVIATTLAILAPFLSTPDTVLQIAHRVFPFARGIFEDKVANFWCTVNVVIKLRTIFSEGTLARLALLLTSLAVAPLVVLFVCLGYWLGRQPGGRTPGTAACPPPSSRRNPALSLLPLSLFSSALAFFLFSFQVHEKSILLALMPLTLLGCCREAGEGRREWGWAVLVNNAAAFRCVAA